MKQDILEWSWPETEGAFKSRKRDDWESVKGFAESGKSSSVCFTRQVRAPGLGFSYENCFTPPQNAFLWQCNKN